MSKLARPRLHIRLKGHCAVCSRSCRPGLVCQSAWPGHSQPAPVFQPGSSSCKPLEPGQMTAPCRAADRLKGLTCNKHRQQAAFSNDASLSQLLFI